MDIEEPGADKLREYEAIVELVNKTNEPLSDQSVSKIDELIEDLNNQDDPVYLNNCLQLIADLARSPSALAVLEAKQVPQKLLRILDQRDPLIVPHAMKLFYHISPKDLQDKYPQVLNTILDYCQSEDKQLLDYAIDLIAFIGRRGYAARKVLSDNPKFREQCLKQLGLTIINSDSLIKCRALACIRDLLEVHENDPIEESSQLSDDFYHSIIEGENKMTNRLFALCKVPFKDISASALLVIETIKDLDWGQKELAAQPGLLEFIKSKSCSYKDPLMNSPAFCSNS